MVQNALYAKGIESELVIVKTSGDNFLDKPFRDAGVGAFVREIDDLMRVGDIDLAVHSMKDVPTKRPKESALCAVLPRASPYDVLVYGDLSRSRMVVGTSSLRRRAQIARYYPSYICKHIRGNIDTRMKKLASGEFSGLVIAEAGLERLNLLSNKKRLPFIPSPNQGIVGVMANRALDEYESIATLSHEPTLIAGAAERIIMEALGGGCLAPLGIFAQTSGISLTIAAEVLSLSGDRAVRLKKRMLISDYEHESRVFAQQIKECGGEALIAEAVAQSSAF
ncbi:MAG: hydroxymethylbilane synthase [Euryarchaeota archaeon]|nr:hydroxymethylbilane synthase [Euryarchaeota archaeon]